MIPNIESSASGEADALDDEERREDDDPHEHGLVVDFPFEVVSDEAKERRET